MSDLREQGYYEARADHQLRPGAQTGAAELVINVDGGARITVVFEGDPLSQKERRELVPIEREGSVDEDLLEDSANRIEGTCARKDIATPTPSTSGRRGTAAWRWCSRCAVARSSVRHA